MLHTALYTCLLSALGLSIVVNAYLYNENMYMWQNWDRYYSIADEPEKISQERVFHNDILSKSDHSIEIKFPTRLHDDWFCLNNHVCIKIDAIEGATHEDFMLLLWHLDKIGINNYKLKD